MWVFLIKQYLNRRRLLLFASAKTFVSTAKLKATAKRANAIEVSSEKRSRIVSLQIEGHAVH